MRKDNKNFKKKKHDFNQSDTFLIEFIYLLKQKTFPLMKDTNKLWNGKTVTYGKLS